MVLSFIEISKIYVHYSSDVCETQNNQYRIKHQIYYITAQQLFCQTFSKSFIIYIYSIYTVKSFKHKVSKEFQKNTFGNYS